ncbi:hypothetical protein BH10ACT1_BH10ACT1_14190 [soil metagenome]
MLSPSEVSGLPAHPLIVHIPVVFIPLALLAALAAIFRPAWRSWLLPLVAAGTGISAVAVQLAVGSGRKLEDTLGESELIEKHEHLALQLRPMVFVFFLVALAALVVHRRGGVAGDGTSAQPLQARMAQLLLPLCVLSGLLGVLATTWTVRTGDAGSKATWQGQIGYSQLKADGGGGSKEGGGEAAATTTTAAADPGSGSAEEKVEIVDFAFNPKDISIKAGGKVTWTNSDSAKHNAQGRGGPTDFKTKDLSKGDSDTVTFDEAGEYEYVCSFHTYMKGRVMVSG